MLFTFTTINVLAGNIDKAKIGQKIFAQAIEKNEITISSNEDDDFKEIDEIIGNCEISDEEMDKVLGKRYHDLYYKPSGWSRLHGGYDNNPYGEISPDGEIFLGNIVVAITNIPTSLEDLIKSGIAYCGKKLIQRGKKRKKNHQ